MTIRPAIATPEAPTTIENADITVVGGAGHVGIPLVLAFAAKGLSVNVNDLNEDTLGHAASRPPARSSSTARKRADQGARRQAAVLHQHAERDLDQGPGDRHHRHAGRRIPQSGTPSHPELHRRAAAALCATANLLVLRSTLFPGTTDWIDAYLKSTGPQAARSRSVRSASCRASGIEGAARDAADRQRHARRRPRRGAAALFERIAPEVVRGDADRGGVRQAVQQRLPLHRIRRHQSVLPDREVGGRSTTSAILQRDEAQLSARQEHPAAGLCRRSLPGQGHDAASGFRAQRIRARQRRDHGQRGPGRCTSSATCGAATISPR